MTFNINWEDKFGSANLQIIRCGYLVLYMGERVIIEINHIFGYG